MEGFLSLNHKNATGNAGLKDQNLALKWVQANIEKFGGNPNNVTIFGQSAGAVSVGFHTISDASAGLFHGAISMSGTPLVSWGFQTPQTAQSRAEQLGASIGVNSTNKATLLQAFYNISAAELAVATSDENPLYFTPTIETASIATHSFITECSINKYYSGKFNKVPQLIDFMEQETVVNEDIRTLHDIGMSVPAFLESIANSLADDLGALEYDTVYTLVDETTETLFINPIDMTQRILAAYNGDNPVFYYRISFYTDGNRHNILYNTSFLGAGHTDDIPEIFYAPYAKYDLNEDNPVTRTIYRLTTMWTNFAKYGNPTPGWVDEFPLNITWPVSGHDGLVMYIGNELTVGPRPINANVEIIELLSAPFLKTMNGCETSAISSCFV